MKLCTVCGVVTSRAGSRCTEHARQSNRSRHNAFYSTRAWQRLGARVLRAWRGEHRDWCPGYRRAGHRASDLTVDHIVPLAAGGAPFDIANTAVLCRSCNSTKGASTDRGGVDPRSTAFPPDIEAEGPIFPKAIAELIGSTRDAVQKLVGKMVATGSIARATGGYVVAGVRVVDDAEDVEGADEAESDASAHSAHPRTRTHTPAGVPTHSTHSSHSEKMGEGEEGAGTHVHAREARCAACGRVVELDGVGVLRPHYRDADLADAKWGRGPCPGAGTDASGPALRVVRADPTGWTNPCHWYSDHQFKHRQTPSGWTCDACYPEEGPIA